MNSRSRQVVAKAVARQGDALRVPRLALSAAVLAALLLLLLRTGGAV